MMSEIWGPPEHVQKIGRGDAPATSRPRAAGKGWLAGAGDVADIPCTAGERWLAGAIPCVATGRGADGTVGIRMPALQGPHKGPSSTW